MSLLALLFALACERGLTHLLHLREWRWLDPLFDAADRKLGGRAGPGVLVVALLLVALPVLPVLLVSEWLGPQLLGLPQFAFAVLVLLFAFGPRDLKEDVDDYLHALEQHDRDEAQQRAKELLESSPTTR
ncbi:MAG: regulatory signaling modulator protein AmpE, partial [Steroidobacteraceae bacterium]